MERATSTPSERLCTSAGARKRIGLMVRSRRVATRCDAAERRARSEHVTYELPHGDGEELAALLVTEHA